MPLQSRDLLLTSSAVAAVAAFVYIRHFQRKSSKSNCSVGAAGQLIATRRSIFPQDYDPSRKVPRDHILQMLEAANWAPSHSRTEPWRFVVFTGESGLRKLGLFEQQLYKQLTPSAKFNQGKYQKKLKAKLQSSHVIAICMKRQPSEKLPEVEEIEAVACAVQNMHLMASALGVGAYWSSGATVYSQEMKDFLQLGEKDKCLGLFYVGYLDSSKEPPTGRRKNYLDKITWVEN